MCIGNAGLVPRLSPAAQGELVCTYRHSYLCIVVT